MCEPVPGLSLLGIMSDVGSTVKTSWKPLAATVAVVAVCSFVAAYAVYLGTLTLVFVGAVGSFAVWTRKFRKYEDAPEGAVATVTTRQGQGARAITAGQRALPAPAKALPAAELTGRVVPAPVRGKVVR
jgi:hypothetical protein